VVAEDRIITKPNFLKTLNMKKTNKAFRNTLLLTPATLLLALSLIGCNTASEKVENAKKDVAEANIALTKAEADYATDIEKFRKETDERILANQKNLDEFNARISRQKKDAQLDYKNKIAALEQKNTDMKKKIDDYKAAGKENWEKFKLEFNKDMSDLGKAFSSLTDKNLR
jgi:hypothetical protein